jgi:hypothetical protein
VSSKKIAAPDLDFAKGVANLGTISLIFPKPRQISAAAAAKDLPFCVRD